MGIKLFVLFSMVFLHIVDDYYLQGWLASAKQREWWKKNTPGDLYRHDYIMALFMHSFSWSFMIMLPCTIYIALVGGAWFPLMYLGNIIMHMVTDNEKANEHSINLVVDQLIHLIQIIATWVIVMF